MNITLGTVFGYLIVALFWGITNPFMKKGTQGIETVKSTSVIDQFLKDVYFLVTNLEYFIPFLINQIGSILNIVLLQQSNLSLTVVSVNSLTFVITALTGKLLGEERVDSQTCIGAFLILMGTFLCCIG
ncbi:transmembrane protein 234 homolog isoform X2 [Phymastichus coffea]|uniref:transmembrane protein 234 homolog isoform X2 n=1 Tax=Phymastichus coffea TaxID=108790 RepID=UPI00273BF1DD|nr:transmembrane protein 234 homolog isoform X2 [Phymastichus coffea]